MSEQLWEQPLSGAAIREQLNQRVQQWGFDMYSPFRHTLFTHNVADAVLTCFAADDNQILYPDRDRDIPGDRLPGPLQELVLEDYCDEIFFANGNEVTLRRRNQHVPAKRYIRGLEHEGTLPFDALVEMGKKLVAHDPTSLVEVPAQKDETIIAEFRPRSVYGWGLTLEIGPSAVTPAVFGEPDKTGNATAFVATHYHNRNMWASIGAHLSLLAVEYADRVFAEPVQPITAQYLDYALGRRLS